MLPRKRTAVHGSLPDGDAALVDGIRRGVLATFEQLFRANWDPLCRCAFYHLRCTDDAEDVAQRVFARIWQNRGEWSVRGSLRDYLFLATRNASFEHLRHLSVARRWRERRIAERVSGSPGSQPHADALGVAEAWRKLLTKLDAGTERVATAKAYSVHRGPPERSERRVVDVVRSELERLGIWYAGVAALLLAAGLPPAVTSRVAPPAQTSRNAVRAHPSDALVRVGVTPGQVRVRAAMAPADAVRADATERRHR